MALLIPGTGLNLNAQRIQNLADGTAASDAVTKSQLDAIARGLDWKNSVRAATTANITLSAPQTVDGVSLVAGDRVLVKDQTTASANGVYVVAAGAWTRATDYDDAVEITAASAIPVETGTANGDRVFILTTDGAITVGTTSLAFTQLGGSGTSYTAGNGLSLTGSVFAVVPKGSGGLGVDGSGVFLDTTQLAALNIPRKYAIDVPSGSTTATITHNLGTTDVHVQVIETTGKTVVLHEESSRTTNTVVLAFATAPTSGQYRAIVIG